jgi:hypothetical protein
VSRRAKVPAEGPAIFQPDTKDWRPVVEIPVGGVVLQCRFPLATARRQTGEEQPVVAEVIEMSSKPKIVRPWQPDPYSTLPLEEPAA